MHNMQQVTLACVFIATMLSCQCWATINIRSSKKPSAYRKGQQPVGVSKVYEKKLHEEAMKLHHKEIMDKKMLVVKNNLHMKQLYEENARLQYEAQQQQLQQYQQTMQQVYQGQSIVLSRAVQQPTLPVLPTPQKKFSSDVISRLLTRKKQHGSVYLAKIHQNHEGLTIPKAVTRFNHTSSKTPNVKTVSHGLATTKGAKTSTGVSKSRISTANDTSDDTAPAHEILRKLIQSSKTFANIHTSKYGSAATKKAAAVNEKEESQKRHAHHKSSSNHHSASHKAEKKKKMF
jgi:hypothetical protein